MADVGPSDASRGQLILVAGLTITVILVALVLLLNTVIYTENVATRGIDTGGDDALEYRATVVDSVEELIAKENAELYDDDVALNDNVTDGIDRIDAALKETHIRRGVQVNLAVERTNGTHAWMENDGDFEDGDIVTGGTEIRRFEMDINDSGFNGSATNPFEIEFEGTSYFINRTGGSVVLERGGNNCTVSESIDFVEQTVDDSDCDAVMEDVSGSSLVRFHHNEDDEASGNYSITTDGEPGGAVTNAGRIVYGATVDVRYETRDVRFNTSVDIEGAEPR